MPDPDFTGLDRAARAAFKPSFPQVQRRAVRRRRTRITTAALTALMVLGGAGVAVAALPGGGGVHLPGFGVDRTPDFIPTPGASASPGPGNQPAIRTGPVVAGDLDHLYLRWNDCRDGGCTVMVAGTADRGKAWRSRPLPLPRDTMAALAAAGPRTLVVWYQADPQSAQPRQGWLASTDAGTTWREVPPKEAVAVPAGWRVISGTVRDLDHLVAADPVTGDVVEVTNAARLELSDLTEDAPAEAGIWGTGYASTRVGAGGRLSGQGSAVTVSRDGGRTWQRHVFTRDFPAREDVAADVATRDGRTVYAVGRAAGALVIERSGDGGRTWQRATGTATVGERQVRASVRPDGTLVVQAGLKAGEDPLMFTSADGGRTLRPAELGPGAAAVPVPGGYLQTGWPDTKGAWLSSDGVTWSYLDPPQLP